LGPRWRQSGHPTAQNARNREKNVYPPGHGACADKLRFAQGISQFLRRRRRGETKRARALPTGNFEPDRLLDFGLWRHAQPPDSCVLGDAPAHGTICCEEPVFAGKVTCGVRNETSGQSWPSSTVATDPFTGAKPEFKRSSGVQHKRLGGWRPKTKTLYLTFLPNQPRQRPFYSCDGRGVGAFASN
jgi:hypothetical protein